MREEEIWNDSNRKNNHSMSLNRSLISDFHWDQSLLNSSPNRKSLDRTFLNCFERNPHVSNGICRERVPSMWVVLIEDYQCKSVRSWSLERKSLSNQFDCSIDNERDASSMTNHVHIDNLQDRLNDNHTLENHNRNNRRYNVVHNDRWNSHHREEDFREDRE